MLSRSQQLLYQIIKDKKIVDDKTKLAKFQYLVDFIHFAWLLFFSTRFLASPIATSIL